MRTHPGPQRPVWGRFGGPVPGWRRLRETRYIAPIGASCPYCKTPAGPVFASFPRQTGKYQLFALDEKLGGCYVKTYLSVSCPVWWLGHSIGRESLDFQRHLGIPVGGIGRDLVDDPERVRLARGYRLRPQQRGLLDKKVPWRQKSVGFAVSACSRRLTAPDSGQRTVSRSEAPGFG